MNPNAYLGDSVYVSPSINDPEAVKIYTSNHPGEENNIIYLDQETRAALLHYLQAYDEPSNS